MNHCVDLVFNDVWNLQLSLLLKEYGEGKSLNQQLVPYLAVATVSEKESLTTDGFQVLIDLYSTVKQEAFEVGMNDRFSMINPFATKMESTQPNKVMYLVSFCTNFPRDWLFMIMTQHGLGVFDVDSETEDDESEEEEEESSMHSSSIDSDEDDDDDEDRIVKKPKTFLEKVFSCCERSNTKKRKHETSQPSAPTPTFHFQSENDEK